MTNFAPRLKKRFSLSFLTVFVFCVATTLFFVNTRYAFLTSHSADGSLSLDQTMFILSSVALILFEIGVLCFSGACAKVRVSWGKLATLSLFFVASLLGIFLFRSLSNGDAVVYKRDGFENFTLLLYSVSLFLTLYLALAVIPKLSEGRGFYTFIYRSISIIAFGAILYSYIVEKGYYLSIFGVSGESFSGVPQSFTSNRNIFGYYILLGLLSELYLIYLKGNLIHWLFAGFFYINLFAPVSKTCILLGTFALLACLIVRLVIECKRKRYIRAFLPLGITAIALVPVLLIAFVDFGGSLSHLRNYIAKYFGAIEEGGFHTASQRFDQFNLAYQIVSSSWNTLVFGFGYRGGVSAYAAYTLGSPYQYVTLDSSMAANLLEGGLFGMVLSGIAWLYLFVKIVVSAVKKSRFAPMDMIAFFVFFGRSFMEIGDLITLTWGGVGLYGLLVLPLLSEIPVSEAGETSSSRLLKYLDFETDFKGKRWTSVAPFVLGVGFIAVPALGCYRLIGDLTGNGFFIGWERFVTYCLLYVDLSFCLYGLSSFRRSQAFYRYAFSWVYTLLFVGASVAAFILFPALEALYLVSALFVAGFLLFFLLGGLVHFVGNYLSFLFLAVYISLTIALLNVLTIFSPSSETLYLGLVLGAFAWSLLILPAFYVGRGHYPAFGEIFERIDSKLIPKLLRKESDALSRQQAKEAKEGAKPSYRKF